MFHRFLGARSAMLLRQSVVKALPFERLRLAILA
jgi:hypothetical protein